MRLTPDNIRFCPLCGGTLQSRGHESVCGDCSFVFYVDNKVVAATIPVDQDGRVLLTRRSIEPSRGKWTFPGGFVEWGEAVDRAAVRETMEETGLDVELDGILGVYSYDGAPVVIIVYRARAIGGSLRTCHENDRVEWVAPADIPWADLAFPSTVDALRAWLDLPLGQR